MIKIAATVIWCAMKVCWPLDSNPAIATPPDYALTSFDTKSEVPLALIDRQYRPEWDMGEKPWRLTGSFQTAGKTAPTQYVVGNRSQLSAYTGWCLLLRNGKLQLIAEKDQKVCKTINTQPVFNDGQEHHFELVYVPPHIALAVDGKLLFEDLVPHMGNDVRRRFAIGSLYEAGKPVLPFAGKLRNLQMTQGTLDEATDASKLDPELKATVSGADRNEGWINVLEAYPDIVRGRGWNDALAFHRFPERFRQRIRKEVWALSTHSAGICLHFTLANARPFGIRWTLTANNYLPHMCPIGVNGLDVYTKVDHEWQWLTSGRPSRMDTANSNAHLFNTPSGRTSEYLIYLPLYTGVRKVEFLLPLKATLTPVPETGKPLVFYGTSIVHGCSASRPGMTYPAILGRRLDLPVINLGFSGHGTLDPEFAQILADIDASAYILDCLPNMVRMKGEEVRHRTIHMVMELRRLRPQTPIVLVEDRPYTSSRYAHGIRTQPHWQLGRKLFAELTRKGIAKLFYVTGDKIIGGDNEATIDGSHPTDLGMMRYADALEPILRTALGKQ